MPIYLKWYIITSTKRSKLHERAKRENKEDRKLSKKLGKREDEEKEEEEEEEEKEVSLEFLFNPKKIPNEAEENTLLQQPAPKHRLKLVPYQTNNNGSFCGSSSSGSSSVR